MAKTSKQIQGDVYRLLKNSTLSSMISGDVYRGDGKTSNRPRDSRKEDAVVIFTSGLSGDIQTGWKSHSTLPLLATQNYPFWLKYD